jgi:hypothetical protein
MICAIWHMLSTGETYRDVGGDDYTNRDPERQTKRLVAQLERLGHHVTLQEGASAARANFPCQANGAAARPSPAGRSSQARGSSPRGVG